MKFLALCFAAIISAAPALAEDAPLSLPPSDTVAAPVAADPSPTTPPAAVASPEAAPAPIPAPPSAIPPPNETPSSKSAEQAPKEDLSEQPSPRQLLRQRLEKENKEAEEQKTRSNKELVTHEAASSHFEIQYILHAFPNINYSSTKGTTINRNSTGAGLEYMFFPLTHGIGRLGFGITFGAYKASSDQNISGLSPNFYTGGAKATFQLQPIIAQVFIPYAVAGYDYVQFNRFIDNTILSNGVGTAETRSAFGSPYYGVGIGIDLNSLERAAASEALIDSGIRKVLLTYTLQVRTGSNSSQNGSAHFLGLRFEF